MPIIKTAPTSHFTQVDNSLINSSMPALAKNVLLYLLSKPKDWQVRSHDIRKQLCLSAYAVKKALRLLCQAGYAAYDRLKSGHTIWRIFSTPEKAYSPAIPPQVEKPQVDFQPVLQTIEKELILKQQQPAPTPPTVVSEEDVVVVLSANEETAPLIFPETLDKDQKKAIKAIAKQLREPAMTQELLFTLGYAIAFGHIKSSVPGYFRSLVTAANEGRYTATTNTGSVHETAADRAERTKRQIDEARTVKVDNNSFFADLQKRFGAKASKAIPV